MGMFNDLKNISTQEREPVSPAPKKKGPEQPVKAPSTGTAPRPSAKAIQKESITASKQASTGPSTLANQQDAQIEAVRKPVKRIGKEVTFVRLTLEEKSQLGDIIYTYKRQGTKTTENEIARIGLSLLIADYQANGEASVLAQVIAALNA
jgi:hypothetical protein